MFEGLSKELKNSIMEWVKENYPKSKKDNKEMCVVFDVNGNNVFDRTGDYKGVIMTPKDESFIKDNKGYIFVHTHVDAKGQGTDFSSFDVSTFTSCNLSYMYAFDDTYVYEISLGKCRKSELKSNVDWEGVLVEAMDNITRREYHKDTSKHLRKIIDYKNLKNDLVKRCIKITLDETLKEYGFKHDKKLRGDI